MDGERQPVWTVSQVNQAVRDILENSLLPFWLQGEVGTLTIHRSGHVYVNLKDARCQLRAVFFNGARQARELGLMVGMSVEVFGSLSVYEVRGDYQFLIRKMRPVGLGDLQRRFEELKKTLGAEGLFDESRKKPIPLLPRAIGVVSSPDGAALRDFLQIVNRRFPNIQIKIYPAAVQGMGAEKQVAAGVRFLNDVPDVDVIVVTRGGGSMEDLWPFNEELLARTIAGSRIPVISAVGHEIDFTICDFVADLRVPTPSAAAELVIGRRQEFADQINNAEKRMLGCLTLALERLKRRYEAAANSHVFREPAYWVREKQQIIDGYLKAIERVVTAKRDALKAKLDLFDGRLAAINPLAVLKRGYAVLIDESSGKAVTSPDVAVGSKLKGIVSEGSLDLRVEGGEKNNSGSKEVT